MVQFDNLRQAREMTIPKLTQIQAADKVGISPATLSKYEHDLRGISIEKLKELCELYNIELSQLKL